MRRWLRRLVCLGILGACGAGLYMLIQRRRTSGQQSEPVWPPMSTDAEARPFTVVSSDGGEAAAAATPARWLPPVDGECPDGYPIKANDASGIFHMPGGRFYTRTIPERCYAKADDAVSDGYRPAKA
jgi:hypothetical protein